MSTVLITGLNGYVAPHVASIFLAAGWAVRGTVRSESKREKVLALPIFKDAPKGKLDVVIVEDFLTADWVAVLDGVQAIAHVASPFDFTLGSYDEFRKGSVDATRKILEAASKVSSITAVGVLSSVVATTDAMLPVDQHNGKVLTEDDWLAYTEEDARTKLADAGHWYCVSKKYAELEARKVHEEVGAKWSLATVCPPAIYGPAEHINTKADLLAIPGTDISASTLYAVLCGGEDSPLPPDLVVSVVDVRDVSQTLYLAIAAKSNERFLSAGASFVMNEVVTSARKARPDLAKFIVKPDPERWTSIPEGAYRVDASKSEKVLGVKYRSLDETIRDTVTRFEQLGAYSA
ncbi:hypothetical protein IAT38_005456 [Cryptococcus sp. DSM 104549]